MRKIPHMVNSRAKGSSRGLAWVALFLAAAWCHPAAGLGPPEADLWDRWTVHSEASSATIDYGAWDTFLARYLVAHEDGVNRVAYGRVDETDRRRLGDFLASLSEVRISEFSRDAQRAYWINFYNALTVKVVLDHYPVASIREIDISPGLFSIGPWGKKLVSVEGEALSLDDIEHRILRPIWRDPRIHYAVNCAALGCPSLMAKAFTVANTESLLDAGARTFINSPKGARFDDAGRLTASSIYDWFQEDFGGDEAGVIAHLRAYAAPPLAAKLDRVTEVYDFDYDWTLNDADPAGGFREPRRGSAQR